MAYALLRKTPIMFWRETTDDETDDEELQDLPRSEGDEAREVLTPRAQNGGTCAALKKMFSKCIAYFLIFSPVALVLHAMGEDIPPVVNFIVNMGAIIPLSWMISESTEHLESVVGPMWGTLLNSTFGNVVEIILSIQAIRVGLIKVVQSSLLGAIITNLTGVLGLCVLAVGCQHRSTKFNFNYAIYNLGLLSVAILALMVPTTLAVFDDWSTPEEMARLSRWVAGMLLFMYIQWLVFNLYSHAELFKSKAASPRQATEMSDLGNVRRWELDMLERMKSDNLSTDLLASVAGAEKSDDSEDEDILPAPCACLLLLIATVLVAFHCDYLVEAIEPMAEEMKIKMAFIATVVMPVVGNFSEIIAAVSIACKGKIDLAIGVAIGSATQIALCVIPVAVFIGWACGQNLDLDFEDFQVKLLATCLIVVILVLLDGKANWLKGSLLITVYVIVASSFWFMHDREFDSQGSMWNTEQLLKLRSQVQELSSEVESLKQTVPQ